MKKVFISLMFVAILFAGTHAKAQYRSGSQMTAGINVGASLVGMLFSAVSYADDPYWKATNIPTVQGSFDYRMLDWLSVGAAISFASTNVNYLDPNTPPVVDNQLSDFKMGIYRMNFAVRGLAYYGNNDMVDLYSGLRLGVNNWFFNVTSNDPDYALGVEPLDAKFRSVMPGVQVILFGGTIYPIETFGINFELAIGQPYFASLGLRYRIGN